jgi:DNA invertase Pin-like site-specific DNA recombinase
MKVGYARTSTIEQVAGLDAQLEELKTIGCDKIFKEQASSISLREQLENAINFVREGDILIVTKIDRLARSVAELLTIIQTLENKKVGLKIINLNLDTQTPTGKLMINVLGSIAQFEREIMLERQREGIAKAKAEGKYRGRKPISLAVRKEVLRLAMEGKTKLSIAKQLKIGEATIYRILKNYDALFNPHIE